MLTRFSASTIALLLTCVLVILAGGLTWLPAPSDCYSGCADDGAGGDCAPQCQDCLCCAHFAGAAALPVSFNLLFWSLGSWYRPRPAALPVETPAREVMHVPVNA